ncbi:MAG: tetratricopeptide repeat protein [Treponemataceae bacterium]|nr:tetratricopeptide repeat protein [Treponemataceae bacterium]
MKKVSIVSACIATMLTLSCATTAPAADAHESTVEPPAAAESPAVLTEVQFVQRVSDMLASGDTAQALALFDAMPEGMEGDDELQMLKASLLLTSGREGEAETLAKDLLAAHPDDVNILSLNVMVAKNKGDTATKSRLLKQILAIDPNNADANMELGDEQALKHSYRNAINYYRKAVAAEPNNTDALFSYGKMSYYLQKDADARAYFERILTIEPENAQALAYLGKLEGENRHYRAACDYLNRAIQSDPDNAEYYLDLGTYTRYTGDYAGAEAAWKKAVSLTPDYFLGYAYLAGLYDELNRFDDAYTYYRKVVEKNPQYYYAYESLGMLAWKKGKWAESRAAFEKARAKNPQNISYALMIAATYWKENDIPQLKKFTETVMKGMDRQSLEYAVVRMYHDMAGDAGVVQKVVNEQNRTKKGKFLYYTALYFDLKNNPTLAGKYYAEVTSMKNPMFFEYRLAEWSVADGTN